MRDRFYGLITRDAPVAGIQVDFSPLLWSIAQASSGRTIDQIGQLVLGQLSPASPFASPVEGVVYPDEYGSDELLRHDKHNELSTALKNREAIPLSELLELRLGTPATYSIVLAVALTVHGYDCEVAVTGPDAEPCHYPFLLVAPDKQIDLFTAAIGGQPRQYRPHRKLRL